MNIFWFRRDLRLADNAGLYHALRRGQPVLCLFIFDRNILDKLPADDRRLSFIHGAISALQQELRSYGSDLLVVHDRPEEAWNWVVQQYQPHDVFTNHDYEPYAEERDDSIRAQLAAAGVRFHTYKDQVIFEKDEVLTLSQSAPYTVFTPYSRAWRAKLNDFYLRSYPVKKYIGALQREHRFELPSLPALGFRACPDSWPSRRVADDLLKHYHERRDYPDQAGTSKLSVHLRFGTISIRELVRQAMQVNQVYLNELIWREFFMQIIWHFPRVVKENFKKQYDGIAWRNDEAEFRRWCEGRTGYPLVDAGMRELNSTGYMHNRVRMVTASFLTKHLLIDWRWGEQYFAEKLLDFELSANNGNWQWAAGTGCDAAPYFRVFNPTEQARKFDPQGKYIRHWVPEIDTLDYPRPMVEHSMARNRALAAYKEALG